MTHTPGPWKACRWWESTDEPSEESMKNYAFGDSEEEAELLKNPFIRIEAEDGSSVMSCHDLCEVSHDNGRLLAAAPDLLGALEAVNNWLTHRYEGDDLVSMTYRSDYKAMLDKTRAAIAKAKGE